jgi:glycosyltransferase
MKISIITVCYNSESTIRDTIKSISSQGYDNIEHIVVDGLSADQTLNLIKQCSVAPARLISEPDNGIYDAMNKGIQQATGDVIVFLNADDFYAGDDVVSTMVDFMEINGLDAAYGDLLYIDCQDKSREVRFWEAGKYRPGAFSKGWVPPHPTFFCRREVYEKFGAFRTDMKIAADFELMLRFIEKHKIKVGYLPRTIVKMRTGGAANGWKGRVRGNIEMLRSFRLNGLKLSPLFFINKPVTKILQVFKKAKSK